MWGGLLDVDETAASLQALVDELGRERASEVALREGVPYVAAVVRADAAPPGEVGVSGAGSYLITGGLGGLGLEVASYLVEQGARRLVLVSRGPPGEDARRKLRDLESRAETRVQHLDVADNAAVRALMEKIPDLRGVIHAAGVTDESVLLHHSWDRFDGVMAPKAYGAWNLHQASLGLELEFFVLFSSAVSLEGSTGHAGYTAANEFLDGLAEYRRQLGLPGLSINWPPWAGVGMQAELERKGLAWRAGKYGLGTIRPSAALATFGLLLRDGRGRIAVLPGWSTGVGGDKARRSRPGASRSAERGWFVEPAAGAAGAVRRGPTGARVRAGRIECSFTGSFSARCRDGFSDGGGVAKRAGGGAGQAAFLDRDFRVPHDRGAGALSG